MGRRVWIPFLALSLAVVAGYLVYDLALEGGTPEGTTLSPVVRRELADRVVRNLELDDGVGKVVLAADRRVCAARVFGTDPLRVEKATDVETVYARVYCIEVKPDNSPGTNVAIPIAMHLGSKVRVERPREGNFYANDVDRIFPSRLRHSAAEDDRSERDLERNVERRLRELPPPG
jgi:hypothetical protein